MIFPHHTHANMVDHLLFQCASNLILSLPYFWGVYNQLARFTKATYNSGKVEVLQAIIFVEQ